MHTQTLSTAALHRPAHHIPAEVLLDYAAGNLPESWSLVVACHLAFCPECRAQLKAMEAIGGALIEALPANDVSAAGLSGLLDRLGPQDSANTPAVSAVVSPAADNQILPLPLLAYVDAPVARLPWVWSGPGLRSVALPVPTGKGGMVSLLRIEPGQAMPIHTHRGEEMTLVLSGGFTDETGRFTRGDVEVAGGDVEHQPVAMADQACICLAVTDAPLLFRGRYGWLLNQWTRLFG